MDRYREYSFNNLNSNIKTCLIKITGTGSVIIYCTNTNCQINITQNGYYVFGILPTSIKIYKDNSGNYYIVRNNDNEQNYRNIDIQVVFLNNYGYSKINYQENFDTSNLTELFQLNLDTPINKIKSDLVNAGETSTYVSKLTNSQYTNFSSLILLSIRNRNGIAINNIYLMHKTNEATTTENVTLSPLFEDTNTSQFNITPTKDGFTFSSNASYRYTITELFN